GGTQSLINQGLISADVTGGTLAISTQDFSNAATGKLHASNGGSLNINNTTWSTAGLINATAGSTITLGGAWNNNGKISFDNATLNLGGAFSLGALGMLNRTGGILNVTGKLDLQGQTLTLDNAMGPWTLIGGTIQNGMITQTGTGKLAFTVGALNTLDNVTV